ncbi:nitroreductase family deazaflavin-dependent oxidoreductase [Thermomicrobiaceae bacterium CFH 74404]|uniref:Nitroreductase family deazaflavin-dependent oxidoreductase n=1 Tax=Thermalbibacter longus TaxID=2951981 RepID=A0AA41W9Q4_9BACT|nr:nitroreductase family deazaflavin-dependent oxidoreductase [Thermalbibacter longus]MCM8748444.1 nitroreductase family deazaflavin-dependent oxidoreductase [Thermalbibacter longus]
MAWTYRLTRWRRVVNALVGAMLRLGLPVPHTYLLTVRGRKTGRLYTTPVTLVERGAPRWLVAPYGEVNWVRNARAAGHVTLSRGRRVEAVRIQEVTPEEAAAVLKEYLRQVPVVRPYFDVSPDDPFEDFVAEAPRHPVFRVVEPAVVETTAPRYASASPAPGSHPGDGEPRGT